MKVVFATDRRRIAVSRSDGRPQANAVVIGNSGEEGRVKCVGVFLRLFNYFHLMHSKYLNHHINYFNYFFLLLIEIFCIKYCNKKNLIFNT